MGFTGCYLAAQEQDGWSPVDVGGDMRIEDGFDVRMLGYWRQRGPGNGDERVTVATARRTDGGMVPRSEAARTSILVSEITRTGNPTARRADLVATLDLEAWPEGSSIRVGEALITGSLRRWDSGWVFVAAIDDRTAVAVTGEDLPFPSDAIRWTWAGDPAQ